MTIQAKLSGSLIGNVAAAVLLVFASSHCATYENNLPDGASGGAVGSGGTGGDSAMGGKSSAAGTPAASGSTSGSSPGGQQNGGSPGVSGSGEPGNAGTGSIEGGAPSEGGQPPSGGGMGGKGGTAGGSPVLLSQSKPATSDSEETAENNIASHANDGDTSTRWCAADGALNHYWRVDLGQARTLTKVHLLWEKDFAYLFKIETSTDDSQWSMAVDETTSSSASASQDHTLPASTKGRYVRITVTGGLEQGTWASLFEVQVFGY